MSSSSPSSQSAKIAQKARLQKIKLELLKAGQNELFEVHYNPPHFWNAHLEELFNEYHSSIEKEAFSTCPICKHKLFATKAPKEFTDPWWIYPQQCFRESEVCPHFEGLTFSILWSQSEPLGAPWVIPCGWGIPAVTEDLAQNDNFVLSVKTTHLNNGATLFWMGFYRKYPSIPLLTDFSALPILKYRAPLKGNKKGYWHQFVPLTIHSPLVWTNLFLENPTGELINYQQDKNTDFWLRKIQNWKSLSYSQPMKMFNNRMVTESGVASFSLGLRAAKSKGALFISQVPIFLPSNSINTFNIKELNRINTNENTKAQLVHPPFNENNNENDRLRSAPSQPIIQNLSTDEMRTLAELQTLWAILDPFQNEAVQEWIRLIKKMDPQDEGRLRPLWKESDLEEGWSLAADSSQMESLQAQAIETIYRDQSPLLVQVTPAILKLSSHLDLHKQSWGVFFISEHPIDEIHFQLRDLLYSQVKGQWIYFRFYEQSFLTFALSMLKGENLDYFYKKVAGWIFISPPLFLNQNSRPDTKLVLLTSSRTRNLTAIKSTANMITTNACRFPKILPHKIYEIAQQSYQLDLPRRIRDFIKEKTPEFSDLIHDTILDRWIRESIKQSYQWGIKKEPHIAKFFLWKIFITPTWCHLSPFIKILQQKVAEEIKIQNIENLLPQLKLEELPRSLSIESWDVELWNELRKANSPLANTDPQSFHPVLGSNPL